MQPSMRYTYDASTFVGRGITPEEASEDAQLQLQDWLERIDTWCNLNHSTALVQSHDESWVFTIFVTVVRTAQWESVRVTPALQHLMS